MKIALPLAFCLSVLASSTALKAATVATENFNYPDGSLTTVSGGNWIAFSGAGTLPVQNVAGVVGLTNVASGGSGEDLRLPLGSTFTTGTLYASVLLSFSSAPSTANGDYFMALYNEAVSGGGYAARMFASTTATGWTIGLTNNGTVPTDWQSDLSLNTAYKVVLRYDADARTATLGVFDANYTPLADSELTLSAPVASGVTAGISSFALRQGSGTSFSVNIDSISVGTALSDVAAVPEPTAAALAGLSLLSLAFLKRR